VSENPELVRAIFAAWEEGDFSQTYWVDPEIEFVLADGVSPGSATGVPAMAAMMRDWLNAWEGLRQVLESVHELEDGRVLALHRFSGRGRSSGLPVDESTAECAALFEFRGGKVSKLTHYFDRARGLEAAALPLRS
jgi:ketosteroid isomerase-like protein